jgi:hypothetical protein
VAVADLELLAGDLDAALAGDPSLHQDRAWRRPMDWSLVGVKRSVVRPDAKVIADGAAAAPSRP